MLPAARLALPLPPRLARRPPLSWRWGAARPLGTGRARRRSEALAGEALAGAPLDTAAKEYSPKVRQLVRDIAGLTLLEVADLNALLKETLKIPDVGVMPAGAAAHLPAQAAPQEEEEAIPMKKEKTHFSVRLTELKATDKVKLIKEVKNFVPGINLVQAKKLVESLPQEIKANVSKEEAEKIKTALEAAGGTVVLE
ncbi:39S ribosomal protein L12, mitochondrial [Gallus gallus]|uniref:Large ribosomal subunit protein bL12m n=1 Tax=Gallus gallus TaxID=9031 RepID=A0A8V1ALS2_CHICK|nr:39S ribosomal protein L12, mitochondrial [Gallus gallus]